MDSPIRSLLFLILFLPSIIPECDVGGTWSTWKMEPNQPGFDYCGSCWKVNYYRECLSLPDCPCNGTDAYSGEVNTEACEWNPPCCPNYTNNTNGICAPVTKAPLDPPPPNSSYCPPSGVGIWSVWGEWSPCSEACGQFGTKKRTRNCTSQVYGCTCYNSDVGPCQTMSCPGNTCKTDPICAGITAYRPSGAALVCYPPGVTPSTAGLWTAWTHGTCSEGKNISRRQCYPSGSICLDGNYSTVWGSC